jgi:hypothetical protein
MTTATIHTDHGEYSYTTTPTNRSIAMTYRFKVFQAFQGKGHGHALKAHQMKTMADAGVRFAMCSTRADNLKMARVLEKAGWIRSGPVFMSIHTECMTQAWTCHLAPAPKKENDIAIVAKAFGHDPASMEAVVERQGGAA